MTAPAVFTVSRTAAAALPITGAQLIAQESSGTVAGVLAYITKAPFLLTVRNGVVGFAASEATLAAVLAQLTAAVNTRELEALDAAGNPVDSLRVYATNGSSDVVTALSTVSISALSGLTTVRSSRTTMGGVSATNASTTTTLYLSLYNKASAADVIYGTTVPDIVLALDPAPAGTSINFPARGVTFALGLVATCRDSTGALPDPTKPVAVEFFGT